MAIRFRLAVLVAALGVWLAAGSTGLASGPPATTLTAAAALERLKTGNERFAAVAATDLPMDNSRRAALAAGQAPYALVLSCADSRVPPEIIFNTGLGELFVVRAAGEVLDKSVLASLEYGAEHLRAPLLVVMGHEFCGAVKAATEAGPTSRSMGPNLDFLIKQIQPAVARSSHAIFDEPLRAAILANVELIVAELRVQSPILRRLAEGGKLQMVGAFYELATGRVMFSHPVTGGKGPVHSTSNRPTTPGAVARARPEPTQH